MIERIDRSQLEKLYRSLRKDFTSEPVSLLWCALAGLILALGFIYAMIAYGPTEHERANFYDSLGKSTNIRWR